MNNEQNVAPVTPTEQPAPTQMPGASPVAQPAPVAAPAEAAPKKAGIPPLIIIAGIALVGYLVYFFLIK